jgi:multidrug efflux pump subunit AcrA (membrane-fusion protein)
MKSALPIAFLAALAGLSSVPAQTPFGLSDLQPHIAQGHRAREAGVMDTIEIRVGDTVSVDQILARLDHERQLHAYLVAKARAENRGGVMIAEGEVQEKAAALEEVSSRLKRRQASEAQVRAAEGQWKAAQGKLEQAKMNAELAKLELALAEKNLERRFIRSGMKGTVIDISRQAGDKVGEGDVVVVVGDLNYLTTAIPLSKEAAEKLAAGATLPLRLAGGTSTRVAQIVGITPLPNGTKGEKLVQIAFSNWDPVDVLRSKAYEVILPGTVKPVTPAPPAPAKKPQP